MPDERSIFSSSLLPTENGSQFIAAWYHRTMETLTRITFDPDVMGGKPSIRGMRVTVGMIVGLVASGHSFEEILKSYPYLELEDLQQALKFAAWRVEEIEVPLAA